MEAPIEPSPDTTLQVLAGRPVLAPGPAVGERDLLALLLADKRSPATRRAYEGDARDFCAFMRLEDARALQAWCASPVPQLALGLGAYKQAMLGAGKAEATVNRRLAAIKSLLKFAHRLGLSASDGRGLVDGERVIAYRDTRGVSVEVLRELLALPKQRYSKYLEAHAESPYIDVTSSKSSSRGTYRERAASTCSVESAVTVTPQSRPDSYASRHERLKYLRDQAILRLLIENALRRAEVCKLDVRDFEAPARAGAVGGLWVRRKGKGSQAERDTLSPACAGAVAAWIEAAQSTLAERSSEEALFCSLDRRAEHRGERLTADGLYSLVAEWGVAVGVPKLTPHKFRHSAITAALEAGLDVRKVQKLSHHSRLDTLMIYDDRRRDDQGEVSGLLSDLMSEKPTSPKATKKRK